MIKDIKEMTDAEAAELAEKTTEAVEVVSFWRLPNGQGTLANVKTSNMWLLSKESADEFQKKLSALIFRTIQNEKDTAKLREVLAGKESAED